MADRVREVRAVYDGKVFVPKEVVPIPIGSEVTVDISAAPDADIKPGTLEALKRTFGTINAPWFDISKFDRGELYE